MAHPDRLRSGERGHNVQVTITLPFEGGSLAHKQLQGVASYYKHTDLGNMIYSIFRVNEALFADIYGREVLSSVLPASTFRKNAHTEIAERVAEPPKSNSEEDNNLRITIPVKIGSMAHYGIEALAAYNKQKRDTFLLNLVSSYALTILKLEGEDKILKPLEPQTKATQTQIAQLEELFSLKHPEEEK